MNVNAEMGERESWDFNGLEDCLSSHEVVSQPGKILVCNQKLWLGEFDCLKKRNELIFPIMSF